MAGGYSPIIVAHRGLHAGRHVDNPENSRRAFRHARCSGIPWVECDVWPSGDPDPHIIVLHDETLDRTTTGGGPILLKCEMAAGHGGVSGRYDAWREAADYHAWVIDVAGASPEPRFRVT